MKKILGLLLAFGMVASVAAANRVGPVSQYGQLVTGKNANGHGRIYGACNPTPGHEVSVRGMSLYWSIHSGGTQFYSETAINKMVSDMKIEIIRIPVGTSENCWSGDCDDGYISAPDKQKALVKKVVDAAVNNDIYVIIDWHSHTANNQVDKAKEFFSYMAQTYGNLDNVIFEIFNEPENQSWDQVKNYANVIIPEIRKYSDNLILVGSPNWDQHPEYAISAPVTDSKNNTAYTFHYYAGSHKTNSEGANAVNAMNAGLSVFVSEWGTGSADGGGNPADYGNANKTWQDWLDTYQLSAANWSASRIDEGTAAFKTSSTASNFYYTASGDTVKKYLSKNPSSYTVCKDPASSGSGWSSSSIETSSSSIAGATSVIDDFEDGNGIANTGLDDVWYAFTDVNDKGASTISNTENTDGYEVVASSAAKSSKFGAGLTGIILKKGSNAYAPYVSLGVNINGGLVGCKTLTYDYKGAGHNLKAITSGDEEGALSEYNYHKKAMGASNSWKSASVPVGDLAQESGWGKSFERFAANVVQLQWEVKGDKEGTQQPAYNYLYIDNLACDGMSFVPVVIPDEESSSSTTAGSSSGTVSSSSSAQSSSSVPASSSSSVAPTSSAASSASNVIDDFADGDNQANNLGEAYWYIYVTGGASVSNTKTGDTWNMVASSGSDYYAAMTSISGVISGSQKYPGAGIGLDVPENSLANCTAITYKYKGSGHKFRAGISTVTADKGYEHVTDVYDASTGWTSVTVTASDLAQPDPEGYWIPASEKQTFSWALVEKMAWVVDEKLSNEQIGTELDIDDVTCVGTLPVVESSSSGISSSSATNPNSSSSYNPYNPYSSSSYNPYNPYSSSAYNPYNPYGIAESQLHSGLKVSMAGSVLNVTVERAGLVKVHVFDMMGHAIESHVENMAAGTYGHSLANLSKGAYIVRVQQGSEQKVIRTQVR